MGRCWRVASLSVRSCITLGINLKNTSENMSNMAKEARYRVWWTLYSFEHLLGIMTGRATSILDGICTSPLPFPFDEEYMSHPMATWILFNAEQRKELVEDSLACIMVHQMPSNPAGGKHAKYTDSPRDTSWLRSIPVNLALCHLYYTDLSVIAQEVVIKVYSIDCAITPWPHIENRIGELRARLDLWHANLREEFRFTEAPIERADDGLGLLRGRLFLAFYYYSTRITLGRPCLCRHDAQQPQPGSGEGRFSHQISIMTLDSSRQMLGLISDDPDPTTLYQTCPWWAVLHYLMQATTILLLELSLGCVHAPQDETKFLEAAKKGVRWFYAMSERSVASRRAWQLCDLNLRRIATGMNYDLTDMPVLPYEPKPRQPRDTTILPYMEQTVPWDMQPPLAAPDISGDSQTPIPDLSQFSLAELDSDPAADPGPSAQPPFPSSSSDSANFPYDSVTREFTRSFFPPADYQRPRDPSAEL